MRFCHPNKHRHISTHISQRINQLKTFFSEQRFCQIVIVMLVLQCYTVRALTSTKKEISAPFMSRVLISRPDCNAKKHSSTIGVILDTKQNNHSKKNFFFKSFYTFSFFLVGHYCPGHVNAFFHLQ